MGITPNYIVVFLLSLSTISGAQENNSPLLDKEACVKSINEVSELLYETCWRLANIQGYIKTKSLEKSYFASRMSDVLKVQQEFGKKACGISEEKRKNPYFDHFSKFEVRDFIIRNYFTGSKPLEKVEINLVNGEAIELGLSLQRFAETLATIEMAHFKELKSQELSKISAELFALAYELWDFRAESDGLRKRIAECHTENPATVKAYLSHLIYANAEFN